MDCVRWVRSGAAVLGSIPGVLLALGVLLVLALVRFASLKFVLNRSAETSKRKAKETPMETNNSNIACSSLIETGWALGVAVASGLALLP
jgi:hypothetical protein